MDPMDYVNCAIALVADFLLGYAVGIFMAGGVALAYYALMEF
jgi:hypothetical protein